MEHTCKHCKLQFICRDKRRKYCSECCKITPWLRRENPDRDTQAISRKMTENKKQWIASDEGKLFYKKLGKHNSANLKRHFKTEKGQQQIRRVAKIQSRIMKERIASGEWTPNITNTWTHWEAIIVVNGWTKKFRSSWEACFWLCNQHLEYETFRTKAQDRTYIADFYDRKNGIIYEIKPKSRYHKSQRQINSFITECLCQELKFIWINEHNILDYVDETQFHGVNIHQLNKLKESIYGKGYNKKHSQT